LQANSSLPSPSEVTVRLVDRRQSRRYARGTPWTFAGSDPRARLRDVPGASRRIPRCTSTWSAESVAGWWP